ncbi:hypothetical protein N7471_013779 [Penicillium samsonianum]|uniref:uncharacterized protein n=1 Tax=Penicillium samsonianum TaxID=1882272 RepID=UPI002546C404|nr:uncharacterized protein N7471_013779 [Penicillium samsonianum]KAJ6118312.1 hypothetical protein N7471_013779 [Penicillium samsonianum]
MIALGIFILSVLLVAIPVTPVPLPAHGVRRNHDLSSDPTISVDSSAKHGRLHRHRRMRVTRR